MLRNSKEILDGSSYYINPLVTTNSPDPGVVRLVDGSGWVMVTTSNNVSRRSNPYAFSMHFSRGPRTMYAHSGPLKVRVGVGGWWPIRF